MALAVLDILVFIERIKGDDSLCRELREHIDDLQAQDERVRSTYAADEDCPKEYASRLPEPDSGNLDLVRDVISELNDLIEIEGQSKGCLSKLIPGRCEKRHRLDVALTHALFHECLNMMRELQDIRGLVLIKRLKLIRRQKRGIQVSELLLIEKLFLHRLVDSCQNDPSGVLGVQPVENKRWTEGTFKQLEQMTDPDNAGTNWGPERETMVIVNKIVKQAYRQIQTTE